MIDLPDQNALADWKELPQPADLILKVWFYAARWTPSDRDTANTSDEFLEDQLDAAARHDDGRVAVSALMEAILQYWPQRTDIYQHQHQAAGILLIFLSVMDEIFRLVHPRTVLLPPGYTSLLPVPLWLKELEFERKRIGWYGINQETWLIPRGPFLRVARDPIASFADNLADRFTAISVCNRQIPEAQRPINIKLCPVGSDAARGVPQPDRPGHETVGFVAVAEAPDDLDVLVDERGGRSYVDFRPSSNLNVSERIFSAADSLNSVDLLVCPELTVGHEDAIALGGLLEANGRKLAGLVLAGSGLSVDMHADERHWNEAVLLNGAGVVLAKQRKVWPFGMARAKANSYEILAATSPTAGLVMENVASGSEISVIDLTGFGRIVIFICQDFEAQPLVSEIIQQYQPDWVLVPILDHSIKGFGWTNNRSFSLSGMSQARFIVSNSLSLFRRAEGLDASPPAIGLAVGPRNPTQDFNGLDAETSRAFALAKIDSKTSPYYALLTWRDTGSDWKQFVLS